MEDLTLYGSRSAGRSAIADESCSTCPVDYSLFSHPNAGAEFDQAECWSQEDDEIIQVQCECVVLIYSTC